MKTPHKHAKEIKAWADGAKIEQLVSIGTGTRAEWFVDYTPGWDDKKVYRVKLEPKPDLVRYGMATHWWGREAAAFGDNIKATFDGETGKLITSEVIA